LNWNTSEKYWLALVHAPNLRPALFIQLLNHFGSPRDIFEAGYWEWRTINLKKDLLKYLQKPNWLAVENDIRWLAQSGNHLLTLEHPDYPPFLREIHQPPLLLFVQGDYTLLKSKQLAIVGTRRASDEGKKTAIEFAQYLSHYGFTITSGLAQGIEGASHWGALAVGGKTIAVAGRGLDQIYPKEQHTLAHLIRETGALVSEFPPGIPTQVKREHFLRCSRIVSGLSLGTLIIDAPKYSNSLNTAYFALEQGREVFAIPGSIHNPLVKGCHKLIKQGAKLVETTEDILKELQIYLY
jgi:DNA processing protein